MPIRTISQGVKQYYYDGFTPTELVTVSRDILVSDGGKILVYEGTTDITLTIPDTTNFEKDFEFQILQMDSGTISVNPKPGVILIRAGNFTTHTLAGKGCAAYIKLINQINKTWYLGGNFY